MISTSMRDIYRQRIGKRSRLSSYDTTGGNRDYKVLRPGDKVTIGSINGNGCVTHIWMTMAPLAEDEEFLYRKVILRMYWDGEEHPSVEVPIGDFFGLGHGITKNYVSAPLQMAPEDGKSLNCFFPMPFGDGARFEVECNSDRPLKFYYYIDFEEYEQAIDSDLRFHAIWKRELTDGIDDSKVNNAMFTFGGKNTTGDGNYVLLDAVGRGHYVGCNLNIHNLRMTRNWNWYGEGDDMIFIDGEKWPPKLHGTGMEDYFNTAWCPQQEYCSPYYGLILGGDPNWAGKISTYRYHIEDPVMFNKSIKVTIEHGHNNHRSDDYSSTAYWYQTEPHLKFHDMLDVEDRLPLADIIFDTPEETEEFFNY